MKAAKAGLMGPRRRNRRGFQAYDHGEPIKTIDTRPMAFVFGVLALVMLFAAAQQKTQALLIDLPWDDRQYGAPARPNGISPPIVYDIRIDDAGSITINDQTTTLEGLTSDLIAPNENGTDPIVRFLPDPNTSYETALHVLGKLQSEGVTQYYGFCFGDMQSHREFGGALQLFAIVAYVPSPPPEFYEACFGPYIPLPN